MIWSINHQEDWKFESFVQTDWNKSDMRRKHLSQDFQNKIKNVVFIFATVIWLLSRILLLPFLWVLRACKPVWQSDYPVNMITSIVWLNKSEDDNQIFGGHVIGFNHLWSGIRFWRHRAQSACSISSCVTWSLFSRWSTCRLLIVDKHVFLFLQLGQEWRHQNLRTTARRTPALRKNPPGPPVYCAEGNPWLFFYRTGSLRFWSRKVDGPTPSSWDAAEVLGSGWTGILLINQLSLKEPNKLSLSHQHVTWVAFEDPPLSWEETLPFWVIPVNTKPQKNKLNV